MKPLIALCVLGASLTGAFWAGRMTAPEPTPRAEFSLAGPPMYPTARFAQLRPMAIGTTVYCVDCASESGGIAPHGSGLLVTRGKSKWAIIDRVESISSKLKDEPLDVRDFGAKCDGENGMIGPNDGEAVTAMLRAAKDRGDKTVQGCNMVHKL